MQIQWKPRSPQTGIVPDRERLLLFERKLGKIANPGTGEKYSMAQQPDFWRLLHFVFRTSDEKAADSQVLRTEIFPSPRLRKTETLLDIGPAEGIFSSQIAGNFRQALFMEKDPAAARMLSHFLPMQLRKNGTTLHYRISTGEFPKDFNSAPADFVLLGQMLYFSPRDKWMGIVESAYRATAPGGALAVVIHGDEGQIAGLVRHFGGITDDIDGFASKCSISFGPDNIDFFSTKTHHWAATIEGLEMLARFFMTDTKAKYDDSSLKAYLSGPNFKLEQPNGVFQITKTDKIVVIFKQ